MPLHIFEPRYQAMIADARATDGQFGMIYHDWDEQGPFLFDEGRIGCVAEIEKHESLDDGRSLIVVRGVERFRITDGLESDAPYYEALVTPYDDVGDADELDLVAHRLRTIELFESVLATLPETPLWLPDFSPEEEVSFALAQTIQVDREWHQQFLELQAETARLVLLEHVFGAALGKTN